jgi:hypothetical protein
MNEDDINSCLQYLRIVPPKLQGPSLVDGEVLQQHGRQQVPKRTRPQVRVGGQSEFSKPCSWGNRMSTIPFHRMNRPLPVYCHDIQWRWGEEASTGGIQNRR